MDQKWTYEQQQAISLQKSHLLISAGAGSGKTAVLVERILQKISDPIHPVDITSLLIVTFTRAAAGEMRERIAAALYHCLESDPGNELLQKQLRNLPLCDITTIDAFCIRIIRNNAVALNIDPSFALLDNIESEMLKTETLDETLEELYRKASPEFLAFADQFTGLKDDNPIKDILLGSYSFLRSIPFYMDWLWEKIKSYQSSEAFDTWSLVVFSYLITQLTLCETNYEEMLQSFPTDEKAQKARAILQREYDSCHHILQAAKNHNWDECYELIQAMEFVTLRMNLSDKALTAEYQAIRNQLKTVIKKAQTEWILFDKESCQTYTKNLYPLLQGFYEAICLFDSRFTEKKTAQNCYEFSDAEHFTLALFSTHQNGKHVPSDSARDIGKNYTEILIDEYQDTNELQEMIFNFIGENCQRFYVGDLKQSIYRFRHANPYIFREKMQTYDTNPQADCMQIKLLKNFRSRPTVLQSINTVFQDIMTDSLGDLTYKNGESLLCGKEVSPWENSISPQTEILLIDGQKTESPDAENFDELSSMEKEALAIAKEIKRLINAPLMIQDKDGERPISFRDIVVLMRSPNPSVEEFSHVFAAEGIPLYADTGGQYFTTPEISTIISILEIIDNPLNDIPLAAVLRSAIFHFNDNELLSIKLSGDFPYYYEALEKRAEEEDDLAKKCRQFLEQLSCWQKAASYLPVSDLLWQIYEDTDFFSICAVMIDAQKKIANLRALYHQAQKYEKTHYRGLYHFIDFLKRVQLSGNDMGEAKILAENQDVVRIMSIHKSKGLEFPVVFCAGLGKRFNQRDLSQNILLHNSLGIGLDFKDENLPCRYPGLPRIAIKLQLQKESLAEEMRLLYVAMTRAKDKLYLTASITDTEKGYEKWSDAFKQPAESFTDYLMTNPRFIDWIMPSVLKANQISSYHQLTGYVDSHLFHITQITADTLSETAQDESAKSSTYQSHISRIQENFSYRYPHEESSQSESKLSVSQINDRSHPLLQPIAKTPNFLRKSAKPTAAQIGTLNHLMMQKIDLHHTSHEAIIALIDSLVQDGQILPEEKDYIAVEEIERFFSSPLGMRLKNAEKVYRETAFEIAWQDGNGKAPLVQGIIDCFFVENDDIVLIDYKTNAAHKSANELRPQYQTQIDIYALAIEKIMKKRPKEKFVYLFSDENVIRYD